jgi:hypothetical protein
MINETAEIKITDLENGNFHLVKGEYTPEEAAEIVSDLFSKKINFHNLKHFSQQIRFGLNDDSVSKRVQELTDAKTKAIEIIENAKASDRKVKIHSTISIEIL